MILQSEINELLVKEDYNELISRLNTSLYYDTENGGYYFYRFLAYNEDYFHMDINNLSDEIDLNRAIELDKRYEYEFFYLKRLDINFRNPLIYALRLDKTRLVKIIEKRNLNKVPKDFCISLEKYLSVLDIEQLKLTLLVMKWISHSLSKVSESDKNNREEIDSLFEKYKHKINNYNLRLDCSIKEDILKL